MTKEHYQTYTKFYKDHPSSIPLLKNCNRILTLCGYLVYPLILLYLLKRRDSRLIRYILIPGICFLLVSAFRKVYNKPRPYEKLDIEALAPREKKGQSFPSRHLFSYYLICVLLFSLHPLAGIIMFLAGLLLAYVRVIFGVHFPIDVLCGALLGILCGIITLI